MEGAYVAIGVLLAIILYLVGRTRLSTEINKDDKELETKLNKQEEVVNETLKEFNDKRDKFIADHLSDSER